MTANTIRSYDQTNSFTDNELQLDEVSYSNRPALPGGPFRLGVSYQAVWRPLYQRSIRCISLDRISRALHTPNVFMRTTWAKMKGLLDFQLLTITPPPFCSKYCREAAPHRSGWISITACRLSSELAPTTLP